MHTSIYIRKFLRIAGLILPLVKEFNVAIHVDSNVYIVLCACNKQVKNPALGKYVISKY